MRGLTAGIVCGMVGLLGPGPQRTWADELPSQARTVIEKGLAWVAQQQQRDGHWEASGGQYPTTMTGLAGMASTYAGFGLRLEYLAEHSAKLAAATLDDVAAAAAKYLAPAHGVSVVLGDADKVERPLAALTALTRVVAEPG